MNDVMKIIGFAVLLLCSIQVTDCKCSNKTENYKGRYDVLLNLLAEQPEAMKCAAESLERCIKGRTHKKCVYLLTNSTTTVKISASSTHSVCNDQKHFRINAKGAWCVNDPGLKKLDQYVQVTLTKELLFRGVVTKGRYKSGQRVTEYRVSYSKDCTTFYDVGQVFAGNWDHHTAITNIFDNPVRGRCIRINPIKYNDWMSMRFDFIGCEF